MTADGSSHDYGEPGYWDQRYLKDPAPFDWYQKYDNLAPLLDLYLQRHHRVLLVGCGNSALGEGMAGAGYDDIVNIDISSVVIESMQKKYQHQPSLKYMQMDARDMSKFESGSFDAVIDKGTLDSLMCGHHSQENASKMIKEVGRILKDKGVYVLITYGDPSYRLYLLRDLQIWDVNVHVIDRQQKESGEVSRDVTKPISLNKDGSLCSAVLGRNNEVHYIYVCKKDESVKCEGAS